MENANTDDSTERMGVCRAIEQEFHLAQAVVAEAVYFSSDWPGEVQAGAVILVETGDALPLGDTEAVAQIWMNVNDRLEEQGIDLYCEIKTASLTAFYRFS